jgi:hypothetical protein
VDLQLVPPVEPSLKRTQLIIRYQGFLQPSSSRTAIP